MTVLHCPPLPLGIVLPHRLPCLASHQSSEEEVPEAGYLEGPRKQGLPRFLRFPNVSQLIADLSSIERLAIQWPTPCDCSQLADTKHPGNVHAPPGQALRTSLGPHLGEESSARRPGHLWLCQVCGGCRGSHVGISMLLSKKGDSSGLGVRAWPNSGLPLAHVTVSKPHFLRAALPWAARGSDATMGSESLSTPCSECAIK